MNIANLLARSGRSFADHAALARGDELVRSYGSLAKAAAIMAGNLRERWKLAPGERVALFMANTPHYVELFFAAWHAGLVVVPINAKLHPREVRFMLEHSGARLCFVTPELVDAVAVECRDLPDLLAIVDVEGKDYTTLAVGDPIAIAPRGADELAWIFYTSGTTGRPKGAMLSHGNLMALTLCFFADVDSIAPGDAILHAAPMSHGSGLYIPPHIAAAACHVTPTAGHFDTDEIFDLIGRYPGTRMFAAPTMVRRLVDAPRTGTARLDNLKSIIYGGAPMYLEDCRRALAVLGDDKLVQIYGQGESPMTITALSRHCHRDRSHPRYLERLASVGVAQTAVEVVVAGPDDQPLPAGESGEILVRGAPVMLGYWQDRAASEAALRNGWLHTGDIGAFDADGFLTLMDRSKDVIISAGSNIYPREVEEVLLRHDGVEEVAVVGLPDPDWGEAVVAFVVRRADSAVDERQLDALCLQHIGRFKRPKRYCFVDSLPKNNYGKIVKTLLRAAPTAGS